jgi:hypothetical protein
MQSVLGALIGVPATMLVAGGLGLVGVTLWSRLVTRRGREPIRWAHLALGAVMFGAGALLIELEILLFGAG